MTVLELTDLEDDKVVPTVLALRQSQSKSQPCAASVAFVSGASVAEQENREIRDALQRDTDRDEEQP